MARTTRRLLLPLLCAVIFVSLFHASCSQSEPSYRVALIGFEEGSPDEGRNALADFGLRRVEAELDVKTDFFLPGEDGDPAELFASWEEGNDYDLVMSLGQDSSWYLLESRPPETTVQTAALDFETSLEVPGEEGAAMVRYRVEEGAYICGFVAGSLTAGNDHPLTNVLPLTAFIGALDDPLEPYYDGGFFRGVEAATPGAGTHRYYLDSGQDLEAAEAYAEEAIEVGVDIFFCTPGPFNEAVLEVVEREDALVILVGEDRASKSPDHVLSSLILRDDNAIFEAVSRALEGELEAGQQVWGIEEGVWSLAPFNAHDLYIDKDLKEALREEMERVSGIDFS
ncbi:MAG: BMP family ABC transporter substrate-binding protein [Actinomycetota bacterium]|nr:BMP family ABC transporter substrate-binding protein [Actinomycetota bacterium]